jgi:hypothetical protein
MEAGYSSKPTSPLPSSSAPEIPSPQKNPYRHLPGHVSHPLPGLGAPPYPKGRYALGFTPLKLSDFFTDDRSFFPSCKRPLSSTTLQTFDNEAGRDHYQLDLLLMQQVFGPDRRQKDAHLTQASQSF